MKKKRGFAAMSEQKRREIAAKGGRAAQATGKTHRWTRAEAVEAGRRGGKAAQANGTAFHFNSTTGRAAQRKRKRR